MERDNKPDTAVSSNADIVKGIIESNKPRHILEQQMARFLEELKMDQSPVHDFDGPYFGPKKSKTQNSTENQKWYQNNGGI